MCAPSACLSKPISQNPTSKFHEKTLRREPEQKPIRSRYGTSDCAVPNPFLNPTMVPLARLSEMYKTLFLVSLLPTNYREPFPIFSKSEKHILHVCVGLLLSKHESRNHHVCAPVFVFLQNVCSYRRMCVLCLGFFQKTPSLLSYVEVECCLNQNTNGPV